MKINCKTAARFAGLPASDLFVKQLECHVPALHSIIRPISIFKIYNLTKFENGIQIEGTNMQICSPESLKLLESCEKIVILAASLSLRFERELNTLMKTDMEEAVFMDALGSAAAEAILDELQDELKNQLEGWYLTDRFSCGYAGLPLSLQKEISQELNLSRFGIYVMESGMLVPSKSVTAFIGLSKTPVPSRIKGCDYCQIKETCQLKKKGNLCRRT